MIPSSLVQTPASDAHQQATNPPLNGSTRSAMAQGSGRKVIMIQQGARREYIYARQLEQAGMLHTLYCDAAWTPSGARILSGVAAHVAPGMLGAISRRTVLDIHPDRIKPTLLPNLASLSRSFVSRESSYEIMDRVLGLRLRAMGLRGAEVVVNYFGNGGAFLEHAKTRGARVITDFISHPSFWRIVEQERTRWSGLEEGSATPKDRLAYERRVERLLRISDIYLCPSRTVAEGLSSFPQFDPARVRIVPYGFSGGSSLAARPRQGRVLFAASLVSLAKGLPYLAAASAILKVKAPSIRICVAGMVATKLRSLPGAEHLDFLGVLNPKQMAEALSEADVFCLPSLAEGSPSTIFEALANGVPVVTTASSGSVVRDGHEGFVVEERNEVAIAEAVSRIVGDRRLRDRMSACARKTAELYTSERCGHEFLRVVRELL